MNIRSCARVVGALTLGLLLLAPVHAGAQSFPDGSRAGSVEAGGGAEQAVREYYFTVETYVAWRVAEDQRIADYVTAVIAEQARKAQAEHDAEVAREAAAARAQPASQSTALQPEAAASAPSTGACGGATNGADQYIYRESHGNPGVFNTAGSGAYGCYQIMPATWASSCSDLGPEVGSSPATQAACASRLPLSAWGG